MARAVVAVLAVIVLVFGSVATGDAAGRGGGRGGGRGHGGHHGGGHRGHGHFIGGFALGATFGYPWWWGYPYPYYYGYPYDYGYLGSGGPYDGADGTYVSQYVASSSEGTMPPPPAVQREVVYPQGKYVLYGDGVTRPWQWVWFPAANPQ